MFENTADGEPKRREKVSPELKAEIASYLKAAEERFGFRCVAVYNKFRSVTMGRKPNISILITPRDGSTDKDLRGKARQLNQSISEDTPGLNFHASVGYLTEDDLGNWFARHKDRPGDFPIKDMQAGSDLIGLVIYGEETMARWRQKAKIFFGREDILEFWRKSILTWRRNLNKRERSFHLAHAEYLKERRELLNQYEVYEMYLVMQRLKEITERGEADMLVAIDGSGRPLGKTAEKYLERKIPIVYLSPHGLRKLDLDKKDQADLAARTLKEEFPELYAKISSDPSKIIFLEDQTGDGHTYEKLSGLIQLISGKPKSSARIVCMSQWNTDNAPSWLRKREIQGIRIAETAKDEITFRAIESPTPQSALFYERLSDMIDGWEKGGAPKKPAYPEF